jgi:hypothetical protein
VTVASGARFIWPFNLEVGHGVRLIHATAQPVCTIDHGDRRTVFLAATPGIPVELRVHPPTGDELIRRVAPSRAAAVEVDGTTGKVDFVVLTEADSLALWKGTRQGREQLILTPANVVFDGATLRLTGSRIEDMVASQFPPTTGADDGVFQKLRPSRPATTAPAAVEVTLIREAEPARDIPLGKIAKPVAAAPKDVDFNGAAAWRIRLPAGLDLSKDVVLRLHYRGDVARVLIGDRFVTDDFYNGRPFEVGLRRHAADIARTGGELRLLVLPLRRDAPVFLAPDAWPQSAGEPPVAALAGAELIQTYTIELTGRP